MIEITHLTKKYGSHVAVDDLSLTVEPGKIYGFLGPNGAGKSTTMNIITGYLGATAGEVKINGFDVLKQPEEAKKCIGYLPELPPLYTEMTVGEYIYFVAELKKIPKADRKSAAESAMEMTGITGMQNRLIRNLSKGYKQRVGLAQAILGFPEIIILDEPTVGLDPKQIIEIRELIQKLGENHTVILSSHILTEISAVCDHIFIISKGKLVASDSTENLVQGMQGGMELNLEVKATEEKIRAAVENIPGIVKIEAEQAAQAGDKVSGIKKVQAEETAEPGTAKAAAEPGTAKAAAEPGTAEAAEPETAEAAEPGTAKAAEPGTAEAAEPETAEAAEPGTAEAAEPGTVEAAAEPGICRIKIKSEKGIDIREAVFFALADARLPIYKMDNSQSTLEDIFLKLTVEGGEA